MSLTDPTSKMSKSHRSERSRILITDTPDEIKKKIGSALTDSIPGISYDTAKRPGISNLLDILSVFDRQSRSPSQLAHAYEDLSPKQLKDIVSDAIIMGLKGVRERYMEYLGSGEGYVDKIEAEGNRRASESAQATMGAVREAMGMGGS